MDNNYNSYDSYDGEVFLNKLYKDLHTSVVVEHTAEKGDTPNEKVHRYMERLERTHSNFIGQNGEYRKKYLKKLYCENYVIKKENIPSHLDSKAIIEAQEESLGKWLDYLLDDNAKYPMWAKYWVFQGMLKIGTYNEENNLYNTRGKKTTAPFIEADPECIAICINLVSKCVNKEVIDDENLKRLVENGNFSKLYTLLLKQQKNKLRNQSTEGRWVKYNFGSHEDAIKLYDSLQGYSTHWCTASSKEMAISQVCGGGGYQGGDFYVYYTKDENGEYKIPRVAIRMDGTTNIGEIRGVADASQNLEDGFEEVVREKLNTMNNVSQEDVNEYLKIIDDMKMLTRLNQKKEDLTAEEIRFIFELDNEIKTFGWCKDPRIDKIREKHSIKDSNIALEMVTVNGRLLKYIDSEISNYEEIALAAVRQDGYALEYVESDKISDSKYEEIALAAVRQDGYALKYVEPDKISDSKYEEITLAAVKQNGYALGFVKPDKISDSKYEEIALVAVRQDGYVLKYVEPDKLSNYTKIEEVAKQGKREAMESKSVNAESFEEETPTNKKK